MGRLFPVLGFLTLLASCTFDPKPKDGKLACDHGCPSGYVCRTDNRCWHTNTPVALDSGVDSQVFGNDAATAELGDADGPGGVDVVFSEAGRDISADAVVPVDVGATVDLARAETGAMVDTAPIDGAGDSAIDAPIGTGGAGGARGFGGASGNGGASTSGGASGSSGTTAGGGASGNGGASASGGVNGSGGVVETGGTSGSGGASGTGGSGGSNADAAPDVPQGNTDAACVPETDQQMCTRLGKNCNTLSGTDNCGRARSIATCGACTSGLVCGTFTANVCPTVCIFDQSTFDNCVFGQ
jgi:hypothetical protein